MAIDDFIEELRRASPAQRRRLLTRRHRKNIAFFERSEGGGQFARLLKEKLDCRYKVDVGGDFIDIREEDTGYYCHPPGRLLEYIDRLANRYHDDWHDFINPLHADYGRASEHGRKLWEFTRGLHDRWESSDRVTGRILERRVYLPTLGDDRFHSGPVVFFGIFHGLHILRYLAHAQLSHILLLEPDVDAFVLSSYFFDYEAVANRFRVLSLNVGDEGVSEVVANTLMELAPVTGSVWFRCLPVYKDEKFEGFVNQIKLLWRRTEIFVPFDREARNLEYGYRNITAGRYFLQRKPERTVENLQLAVVGSGPSLQKSVGWLQRHRDRLVIVCATSTSTVLRGLGIQPDIQVLLDTELSDREWRECFDPDIACVCYYKADPKMVSRFRESWLVVERDMPNVVNFNSKAVLLNTHLTSGNLAVSFACAMQPEVIYLLGLDLGTVEEDHDHAIHLVDGDKGFLYQRDWIAYGNTNFTESSGHFKTHSEHLMAKLSIERALQTLKGGRVFNLSDGIRIEGSEPARSHDLHPREADKKSMLQNIRKYFSKLGDHDYVPYSRRGGDLWKGFKEDFLGAFPEEFSWSCFVRVLDKDLPEVFRKYVDWEENDMRILIYHRFICDLLTEWYRLMIFTGDPEEARRLYDVGREALEDILRGVEWPSGVCV